MYRRSSGICLCSTDLLFRNRSSKNLQNLIDYLIVTLIGELFTTVIFILGPSFLYGISPLKTGDGFTERITSGADRGRFSDRYLTGDQVGKYGLKRQETYIWSKENT